MVQKYQSLYMTNFFHRPNFHEINDFLEIFLSVTLISHSTLSIKAKVANRNVLWASQQQFKKERILLVTLYNVMFQCQVT